VAEEPSLYDQVTGRKSGLQSDRYSWWVHAAELATYYIPRRYRWLVTPNQWNRGSPINGAIIDSTGTIAARTLAAGMMSGITSPTRPWFKLRIDGLDMDETSPANRWLAECERRMYRVFAESNFYNAAAVLWADLGVFGTAPMLIDEDYENVIQCYNPCFGEYYVANNSKIVVDVFYREITITVGAIVPKFGEAKVSESVRRMYKQGGTSLTFEIIICHAIEPNTPCKGCDVPRAFPFRSVYWERDQGKGPGNGSFLEQKGYHEWPCPTPRWDLVSNDAYGRSPAMDALGDVKQLQQEQKRKAQAIDKMVNPPMIADVQLKNQPASLLPGGVTYVTGMNNVGFKPVYEVRPQIAEMQQDIAEVQNRIRSVFFNDLFMMISQLQTVRTATEIDARREEKLIMLGPVLERAQNEFLDVAIDRTFNIMRRAKLLPPPPPDIQGQFIDVEYVSMLAEAQKAAASGGMERLMQVVGNWAPVDATVIDTINRDKFVKKYGSLMAVDPDVMNSVDEIAAIRQQRAKDQQQQQLLGMTPGAAKAAKDLSDTDVGGGKNALQAMLGQESVAA
jgi:hypothetical protein